MSDKKSYMDHVKSMYFVCVRGGCQFSLGIPFQQILNLCDIHNSENSETQ